MGIVMASLGLLVCIPIALFNIYVMWLFVLRDWRAETQKEEE